MRSVLRLLTATLLFSLLGTGLSFAGNADLYVTQGGISLATDNIFEGSPVRIYATIGNNGTADARGLVRFYLDSDAVQIGSDQPISVLANNSDVAFVDLYPPKGNHLIIVRVLPWDPSEDTPGNNIANRAIAVKADFDRDKIADEEDTDDDNDGVPDTEDAFPLDGNETLDSDGDGQGNNADYDDDNDGVPDENDALPLDPTDSEDRDGDGIGDKADPDDDGDNMDDDEEIILGLDPKKPDTDGDTVIDGDDAFPFDSNFAYDTDKDGVANKIDTDDDGDSVLDEGDPMPLNAGPKLDVVLSTIKAVNFRLKFDASSSFDPNGKIVKTEWDLDGIKKEGPEVVHVFQEPGVKKITLTVYDNEGEGRKREFEIRVWGFASALLIIFTVVALTLAFTIGVIYSLRTFGKPNEETHK